MHISSLLFIHTIGSVSQKYLLSIYYGEALFEALSYIRNKIDKNPPSWGFYSNKKPRHWNIVCYSEIILSLSNSAKQEIKINDSQI